MAQEPTSFEIAVRERAWGWLLELRRRLKVELLLLDSHPSVLLPAASGEHPSARLAGLLEQREPRLLASIAEATKTRAPQSLDVGGLQAVCLAVALDGGGAGALVLAREIPADSRLSREQLKLVASWLVTAIEAHLLSPPAFPSSGLNRVAPLAQLLGHAAERESDRELIRLFGEAIAVWHDIDVSGYVETDNGAFSRDITLPGTRKGERPSIIPALELPDSTELARLPHGHDRFGLPVSGDVYVRRLSRGNDKSWLLVFTGVIDSYGLQRLGAYVALLELALSLSTAATITRLLSAIGRQLSDMDADLETRAVRAIEEVRTTMGAASASLVVERTGGSPVLRVSSPVAVDKAMPRVVLAKRSEQHYTTTVSLGRHESLQFTPRDHAAAVAAAASFSTWVPASLSVAAGRRERRAAAGGFQQVIERSARVAIERGLPVTVVVLLIRDAVSLPGSTRRWVTEIRGQMRASDMAGMLTEGEIGLLLHDTPAEQAKGIAERLRALVGGGPESEILIGVASRAPHDGTADGIVREAHDDAVAETGRPRTSASSGGVNR